MDSSRQSSDSSEESAATWIGTITDTCALLVYLVSPLALKRRLSYRNLHLRRRRMKLRTSKVDELDWKTSKVGYMSYGYFSAIITFIRR